MAVRSIPTRTVNRILKFVWKHPIAKPSIIEKPVIDLNRLIRACFRKAGYLCGKI